MSKHHCVTIYKSKRRDVPVELSYIEETLRRSQSRFVNRRVLTPVIDLDAYQWAAVVDWIDIEFELTRRTQYWKLNERIERLTGRKEFPEALDLGPGRTATRYRLRMQEPDFEVVRKVIDDLNTEYGLDAPARIVGIEVSIDAYPKEPSERARALLHGVLVRHFFPTTRVLTDSRTWPRFYPGLVDETDYTVGRNVEDARLDIINRMTPGVDRPVLYGSTYYVGKKDDPRAFWRIQNKVLDRHNKGVGTYTELPEKKKRVRIEVTLGTVGCREAGLYGLNGLRTFKFTRFQKSFFQFTKPTVGMHSLGGAGAHSSAVKERVDDIRKQRFLNAGVLGLQIREDARGEFRKIELPNLKGWHKMRGSKMPKKGRTGAGSYGTMVVYEQLTRVVERALAGLQRKVRREMVE